MRAPAASCLKVEEYFAEGGGEPGAEGTAALQSVGGWCGSLAE